MTTKTVQLPHDATMQGRNNLAGESFCQVTIETNEETVVELPYGEYTVQWSADGYYTSCFQHLKKIWYMS